MDLAEKETGRGHERGHERLLIWSHLVCMSSDRRGPDLRHEQVQRLTDTVVAGCGEMERKLNGN